jgi:hypothetical protein
MVRLYGSHNWQDLERDIYKDSHKRKDIIRYREFIFLSLNKTLEPYMAAWIRNDSSDYQALFTQSLHESGKKSPFSGIHRAL